MSAARFDTLILALACAGLGIFTGTRVGAGSGDDHAEDSAEEEGGEAASVSFSPEALANLGIEVGVLETGSWWREVSLTGRVREAPGVHRPLHAPLAGRVLELDSRVGRTVHAGEVLAELLRAPLPRPKFTFTGDLLRPAAEEVHDAVVQLRTAASEIEILEAEIDRLEEYTRPREPGGIPLVPAQRAIDLNIQVHRAQRTLDQVRLELGRHGFDSEQVKDAERNGHLPQVGQATWIHALTRNGLWPDEAEELRSALPESMGELPIVIATVAEIVATGLGGEELIAWFQADASASRHFLAIAAMLQEGHSLGDLRDLHGLGAFEERIPIRAPADPGGDGGTGWEFHGVSTHLGEHVAAGAPLLTLVDPGSLWLEVQPLGSDVAPVLEAIEAGVPCRAVPLVRGTGAELTDLRLPSLVAVEGGSPRVRIPLRNEVLRSGVVGEAEYRTWKLRAGDRYELLLPTQETKGVFVLPADAVGTDGTERVIYVPHGKSFKPVSVRVLHEDAEVCLVPDDGAALLFAGDRIVTRGAFALGLALQSGSEIADPHAGHNH